MKRLRPILVVAALGAGGCGTEPASAGSTPIVADGAVSLASSATPRALAAELAPWLTPQQAHWLAARNRPPSDSDSAHSPLHASLSLPERANLPFRLAAPGGHVAVEVRVNGSHAAASNSLGSLRVYPEALGPGSALLLQQTELGVEDYVALAEPPRTAELDYQVELGPGVAGLRLVERSLEFLDASGAPRLRVARPDIVGADGARVHAELDVLDCAVDRHPAPPHGKPRIEPGAPACRVRISWQGASVLPPLLIDPVWSTTGSLLEPRTRFASLVLDAGRVLAAGGAASDEAPLASAEIYDPASGTWAVTGSLSTARSAFTLSALPLDGEREGAIAVGGKGRAGSLANTEIYDPVAGTWAAGPPLPVASAAHAAVRLSDGAILVAGGTAGRATAQLAAGASSWQSAGQLPAAETSASLTLLDDGSVLLIGPNPPRALRHRPGELAWAPSSEPAITRSGHSATRLSNGQVLVVGGSSSQRVELYDPVSRRFSFSGATSEPHVGHSATRLDDGRVVVVGGTPAGSAGGTEIYDPTWGTWTPGPGTPTQRSAHQSAHLDDESVLVFGGVDEDGPLASAERLDAAPVPIQQSEYALPPRVDASITPRALTELWASITRPAELIEGRRYPVLVFLHGNHATCGTGDNPRRDFDCSYTARGSCPAGFVVVPNHRGYDYAGRALAARGFIVVSVNANRGITCGDGEEGDLGFNLARGRLLLRHLQQLAEWDRGESETPASLGVSLAGKLDFTQLGLMGHSRGGEGARAAYALYREPGSPWPRRIGTPLVFRAIFEIAPVDGQTSRVLDADGTAWAVLLPLCDGDVSDLQGVRPFDRMLGLIDERRDTPKSTFVAWGTNHNYFNTEWQETDSPGCENHAPLFSGGTGVTGSAEQRQIGLRSLLAFFSANVGAGNNRALNELFDPTAPLAASTRIDRGHTPSLRLSRAITLEDFSGPSGSSAHGLPLLWQDLELEHGAVPEHDPLLRAASITWERSAGDVASVERFLELPLSVAPDGIDLGAYTHLEFRAGRLAADDLLEPTPLRVQLVNADGSLSEPVDSADHGLRLDGPVGGPFGTHLVLQTARIPFAAFAGASRTTLRAVRFVFPGAPGAHLYLSNLRASLGSASLSPAPRSGGPGRGGASLVAKRRPPPDAEGPTRAPSAISAGLRAAPRPLLSSQGNSVIALRSVANGSVELELATADAFVPMDDQLVLEIAGVSCRWSRHPDGDLTRVVFSLPAPDFAAAPDGERLHVHYASSRAREWDFGLLDKSRLTP